VAFSLENSPKNHMVSYALGNNVENKVHMMAMITLFFVILFVV
jgi:hypothetical protein